jgi:hypothetical protein
MTVAELLGIPSATFARHTLEVMVKAADGAASGQAQALETGL